MITTVLRRAEDRPRHRETLRLAARFIALYFVAFLGSAFGAMAAPPGPKPASTWPQVYSVQQDEAAGILTLRTPFYTVEHDLKRGGAISRITLQHGKAANLLVRPIETRVRGESGTVLADLNDPAPKVTHRRVGLNEIVTVECGLMAPQDLPAPSGARQADRASGLRVKSTFEYRWGYVRIHKEIVVPTHGFRVRELCPFLTVLAPSLSDYGYREGITEAEGAPPFSFGSNRWGKLRPGQPSDRPLQTRYVPRSMIFADPGVEGLEWFVGSDLSQWDVQLTGRRGQGQCAFKLSQDPPGLALSISPLGSTDVATTLTNACAFDFYLAVPLLEGHAYRPWLHASFNRNRSNWVSAEEIRRWAEKGIQTVHCHNDGDYYDWNVALFCCNPLHEVKGTNAQAHGHWDIDELLDLMEWTRNRVGPNGLVIVHNTTTPMFATENFADYVVATEWGYQKWTDRAPDLQDLPLEWSLAGARSRGVISYGTIDGKAPRRLHQLFALEAFLGGVAPWPPSPETFEFLPRLKRLGEIESYRFADWRNQAVRLSDNRCASAIYSRPGEAYLLLANLDPSPKEVTCVLHPEKLPYSLDRLFAAIKLAAESAPVNLSDPAAGTKLEVRQLVGEGLKVTLPGADAIFIHVR